MSDFNEEIKFALKVMVNRKKKKALFAEVDSSFADMLLSFLTLPLGTIVRILKKHDDAAAFGSLTTLYNGLANLDNSYFWSEGAKSILLNPRNSSDFLCRMLKLDISDSSPVEYFVCEKDCIDSGRFQRESVFFDINDCKYCGSKIRTEVDEKETETCYEGVFTKAAVACFCMRDDLQIVANSGLSQIVGVLGITDMEEAEMINVTFGLIEVMELLKTSLISSTPLSDVIFNNTPTMSSTKRKYEEVVASSVPNSETMYLKLMVQKSTKKLLYAEAEEAFVEFLFSLLIIPLGGVESLLSRNSHIKGFDNLYRSAADLIHDKYFTCLSFKNRLIKPKIPNGYISTNHIFPLTEERLSAGYKGWTGLNSSANFPGGKGKYLKGLRTYMVTDDLTVTPFCILSTLSSLNEQKIHVSDVEEVQLQIGMKEALSILKASLTSTSALSDTLLSHNSIKQPKREL